MSDPHTVLLYTSALSPGVSASVIGRIAEESRARNRVSRITGLLIFDGLRFAQLVEGPRTAIDSLLERLQRDQRHHDIRILVNGPDDAPRRFRNWELGFLKVSDPGKLVELAAKSGDEALRSFEALRPEVDAF